MIHLTHGGHFDGSLLVKYIISTERDYIVQGQQACSRMNHTKPQSLDYWLRQFAHNPDTKQADNETINALVRTGFFIIDNDLICPDSMRSVKGLRLASTVV